MSLAFVRRSIRALVGVSLAVLVALILLEVFLRVFDPIGIRYYFDGARYFHAMVPDPDFGYLHAPGYRAKLQGVDVVINSHGLRCPEFDTRKPEGQKRILILGDSIVFGWGAPQDSIFPARLQRKLDQRGGDFRVIAAGAGSWNTRMEYEYLKKRAISYQPDLVVLVIVPNDVAPKSTGFTAEAADAGGGQQKSAIRTMVRALVTHSYVLTAIRHVSLRRQKSNLLTDLYDEDSAAWKDARGALRGIVDLCRSSGARVVVFLYGDVASEFSKAFYAAYSGALQEMGVPFFTLPKSIYQKQYRNSAVDGHPNSAGHRLIANEMYRRLEPYLDQLN
jgi:lysophospholipase L1-like esterase